jgi:hypothetical protein
MHRTPLPESFDFSCRAVKGHRGICAAVNVFDKILLGALDNTKPSFNIVNVWTWLQISRQGGSLPQHDERGGMLKDRLEVTI